MKKAIIVATVLVVGLMVRADVLYWMVSDAIAETTTSGGTADFAALYVVDSASSSTLSSNPYRLSVKTESDVYNQYKNLGVGFEYAGIQAYSNPNTLSFYVEILSGEYRGKRTDTMSYAALSDYILKGGGGIPSSSFVAEGFGSGSTTYNVPEPTSGLLFLIGGMLLGLKRRRQQV